jgi:hypothetical protein
VGRSRRPGRGDGFALDQEKLAAAGERGGLGGCRLQAPAHGANITARSWPGVRCPARRPAGAATAWLGSGRSKNPDVVKR